MESLVLLLHLLFHASDAEAGQRLVHIVGHRSSRGRATRCLSLLIREESSHEDVQEPTPQRLPNGWALQSLGLGSVEKILWQGRGEPRRFVTTPTQSVVWRFFKPTRVAKTTGARNSER